jgi:heme exporter protein C
MTFPPLAERSGLPRASVLVPLGVAFLLVGSYWGLFRAPAESFMGDVQRIMYVHVPTAWNAMLALTFAFGCALAYLIRGGWQWDCRLEAGLEMGVVLYPQLC